MNGICVMSLAAADEAHRLGMLDAARELRESIEAEARQDFLSLLDTDAGRDLLAAHMDDFLSEDNSGSFIQYLISQALKDGQQMGYGRAAVETVCDWWLDGEVARRLANRAADAREY